MTTKTKTRSSSPMGIAKLLRQDAAAWIAGWVNPRTGHGDPDKDKSTGLMWGGGIPMPEPLLESLFAFNDLAHAIVVAKPEWALRHGWELALAAPTQTGAVAVDAQRVESQMRAELDGLGAHYRQLQAAIWAELYGGSLLLMGCDDGKKSDEPLDTKSLRRVQWIRPVPRSCVHVEKLDTDPSSGRLGEPVMYTVSEKSVSGAPQRWHHTRVIRYPGAHTPPEVRRMNKGWDLSVLDRVVSKLSLHDSMWDYTGTMMSDASQGVWKIQGLMRASVSGKYEEIEARFRIADRARSLFRALLLDADKESFEYVHRQFGGIDGLLAQSAIRTAAAAQIPVTVLFGQSPAGLNATGESDIRLWYDRVEQYQEDALRPAHERLLEVIFLSKEGPTAGVEPEGWKLTFRPVRKATPMEEMELRARQAQIDTAYIQTGVLASLEVGVSRFTPEGWSAETQIDVAARERAMRAAIAQLVEYAKGAVANSGALSTKTPAGNLAAPASTGPSQAPKLPASTTSATPAGAGDVPVDKAADAALNGAQIEALKSIIADVAAGLLPRNTGIALITAGFPIDPAKAEEIMGPVGTPSWKPSSPTDERVDNVRADGGRNGVMIAVKLPTDLASQLAIAGGEVATDLHVTLAYLGRRSELDQQLLEKLPTLVAGLAARWAPLSGTVGGLGRFNASNTSDGLDVLYASVDVPGLGLRRAELVDALAELGLPARTDHDFTPHVTLRYIAPGSPLPVHSIATRPLRVEQLDLVIGDEQKSFTLAGSR